MNELKEKLRDKGYSEMQIYHFLWLRDLEPVLIVPIPPSNALLSDRTMASGMALMATVHHEVVETFREVRLKEALIEVDFLQYK